MRNIGLAFALAVFGACSTPPPHAGAGEAWSPPEKAPVEFHGSGSGSPVIAKPDPKLCEILLALELKKCPRSNCRKIREDSGLGKDLYCCSPIKAESPVGQP